MSKPATRRVFFAARPVASLRTRMETALTDLEFVPATAQRLRWLDPSSWHVTLRFVGNVDPDRLASLIRCIKPIQPFTIHLDSIEPFPSQRRPLVLAATGTADEAGHALAEQLETECRALNLPPDFRRWRPHMSLARVRGRQALGIPGVPLNVRMDVKAFVLMESVQHEDGNRYVPLIEP